MRNVPSRSSKVVDFGTNRKRVCNLLLLINSNFGSILPIYFFAENSNPYPCSTRILGVLPSNRDRFLKKKCVNQTVGAPGLANGRHRVRSRRGGGAHVGRGCPLLTGEGCGEGAVPLHRKNFHFGSQIGEFWCKMGAFIQFTYKAGIAFLGTQFPLSK